MYNRIDSSNVRPIVYLTRIELREVKDVLATLRIHFPGCDSGQFPVRYYRGIVGIT